MAYAYLILGKRSAAERAIKTALKLAPDSRIVLRAAARLWDHFNEPEVGREILLRSGRTILDPWLMSAEISLASRANKTSRLLKRAYNLLDDRNFAAKHLSELAGAVGTQLLLETKRTKALPHFQLSLKNPTENAVAQAGWANRRKLDFEFNIEQWASREPDEARAWAARSEGDWLRAIDAAKGWLQEEPFSTNATGIGVFISSVIGDYQNLLDFAVQAWRSNSNSAMCANNLAFAKICLGDLDGAEKILNKARFLDDLKGNAQIVLSATYGLLLMRRGNLFEGRSLYALAIDIAKRKPNMKTTAAWAAAFRAREELRLNSAVAQMAVREFDELAGKSTEPAFATFRKEFGILAADATSLTASMRSALKKNKNEK
jgi:hypothetical protein